MSLTATYNPDLSRVQLAATSLGGSATYAVVERSLNGVLWMPVRGGLRLPVQSGAVTLDDFEFFADVPNHYRVTSFDASDSQQQQFSTEITPEIGSVWLKSIRYPLLNRPVTVENWSEITRPSRDTVHAVVGRSTPIATSDLRGSRQFTMTVFTDLDEGATGPVEAQVFDLVLASGGVWFIHVPGGWQVPGGYVVIGDTSSERVVPHGEVPYRITLPCTVVTPPAPQITGALLTWGTVRRLYGDSWDAARAANPTLPWSTVGSPDDLVVM